MIVSSDSISSGSARAVVLRIMDIAARDDLDIAVAVSDSTGELLCFERTDQCGLPSIKVAMAKAFSAARLKQSTREFLDDGFAIPNLSDARYTSYPGGFPILNGESIIGGVGVSGLAPEEDEALAYEGMTVLRKI